MEETVAVEIELHCPSCLSNFTASPEATPEQIVQRMTEEGPWYALANGNSFEDMVCLALLNRGAINCPDCASPVSIREKSMGALIDMLGSYETSEELSEHRMRKNRPHQFWDCWENNV